MRTLAEIACSRGGIVLEVGFGMGISADYIELHNIHAHIIAIGKGGLPRARRQSRNEFGWCASVGIKRLRNWKKNKWQLTQIFD